MSALLETGRFERDGMAWSDYLEEVPWTRASQEKRYIQTPEGELQAFGNIETSARRAVILAGPKCGDCAWAVPRMMRLLDEVPGLEPRVFFRDEHPDLQDALLTNGKRSIPKLALLNDSNEVIAEWGPRPASIQAYVEKSLNVLDRAEWTAEVRRFYREEGDAELSRELLSLFA